jgi:hypothetical protein
VKSRITTYADQNERAYAALQAAAKDGRAEAATEIQASIHCDAVADWLIPRGGWQLLAWRADCRTGR